MFSFIVPSALRTELRDLFSVVWEKMLPAKRVIKTETINKYLVMASSVICLQEVWQYTLFMD